MASTYVAPQRPAYSLPAPGTKFSKSEVEKIIADVCSDMIAEDRPFVFEETQALIKELCTEIQQRVLRLGYDRYKMVTHACVTEAANQGIRVGSRCLWDPDTDNYATYTHSNEHMHISVVLFAMYWE